jgi:hypothetical protein
VQDHKVVSYMKDPAWESLAQHREIGHICARCKAYRGERA